jgi:hypothetical protein
MWRLRWVEMPLSSRLVNTKFFLSSLVTEIGRKGPTPFMDVAGVGPFLPISVTREERKNFVFTKREDNGICKREYRIDKRIEDTP